jgi:hypothetical protein
MNAVVVRVTIHDVETATNTLREQVVPRVSQAPGFVAGYWTRKEGTDTGLSMILFESEEAANTASGLIGNAPAEGVTIDEVEVREVVEHA